jgi:hypothetical protein
LKAPAALALLLFAAVGYPHWPGPFWRSTHAQVSRPETPTVTTTVLPSLATTIVPAISTVIPEEHGVSPEAEVAVAESKPLSTDSNSNPPFAAIGVVAGLAVAAVVLAVGMAFRIARRRP